MQRNSISVIYIFVFGSILVHGALSDGLMLITIRTGMYLMNVYSVVKVHNFSDYAVPSF